MSFSRWLLYPAMVSLLIGGGNAIAQQPQWLELGRQDGLLFQMNSTTQRSGESVVAYELLLTAPQEINGVRVTKVQIIARCSSRSQVLSRMDSVNDQGKLVKEFEYDISSSERWETPKQDLYGKAFQLACSSR